jgi:hypothetical protein
MTRCQYYRAIVLSNVSGTAIPKAAGQMQDKWLEGVQYLL